MGGLRAPVAGPSPASGWASRPCCSPSRPPAGGAGGRGGRPGRSALLVAARLLLAVDHPTDAAAAAGTGVALPTVAFRLLTPDDVFPVTYRRGVRAHLDVGGRRGEAIRAAVARQVGVRVTGVEPFHLGTSAGSTPCASSPSATGGRSCSGSSTLDPPVVGPVVQARPHGPLRPAGGRAPVQRRAPAGRVRGPHAAGDARRRPADARALRDRRDHARARVPAPSPSSWPGAVHATESDVTDETIDDALAVVRRMWDAGLAHRDIKPGNVLVRDGRVLLIDVAFAEVRPTPWRQAVDLANMMLTLALCSSAEQVYEPGAAMFTPDEIGEAFAASRGVTIPSSCGRGSADGRRPDRPLPRAGPADAAGRHPAVERAPGGPHPRRCWRVRSWPSRWWRPTSDWRGCCEGRPAGWGGWSSASPWPPRLRRRRRRHAGVRAEPAPGDRRPVGARRRLPPVRRRAPAGLELPVVGGRRRAAPGSRCGRTGPTAPWRSSSRPSCDVGGAPRSPPATRASAPTSGPSSVAPRYAGRLYDVFADGCVCRLQDGGRALPPAPAPPAATTGPGHHPRSPGPATAPPDDDRALAGSVAARSADEAWNRRCVGLPPVTELPGETTLLEPNPHLQPEGEDGEAERNGDSEPRRTAQPAHVKMSPT